MVDLLASAGRVLAALFLVVLNGFFVASEFAYVRVRSTAVESMVQEGRAGAKTLQEAVDNLDDYLATTQLGITIASLGLGWIGEPAVAELIDPVLEHVLPESLVSLVAFAIGFGVITFLHVVFGELAPKTIAIARAERMALLVSPPMKFFYYLFLPGIVVFNGTANYFTRLIGVPPASETEETLSEEEILMTLTRSGTEGHVDKSEVDMVERVFELDDTSVREVMIPRPDVEAVPADASVADLRTLVADVGHTRYPVLDPEDRDQVIGFVDVKDVVRAGESGTDADAADVTAGDLVRDLPLVPETASLDEVLAEFQGEHRQMAGVIDEYGSFQGIATVEDVVEAVVGDLRDDFDVADREPSIDERSGGGYAVDGAVPLSALEATLGVTFGDVEVETVGGLVLDRLGRAPEVGDAVTVQDVAFEVEAVDGARISSVLVEEATAEADEGGSPSDDEE